MTQSIISKAENDGLKPTDEKELATTMPYLKRQLKALIARDLWDMREYYMVMNETNDIILKGIEVLQQQ